MFYPGFVYYWRQRARRGASCSTSHVAAELAAACANSGLAAESVRAEFSSGASFGVRRPLRFLAWKLELDEKQIPELAKLLAELRTERDQADVDARRAASTLADLATSAQFDAAGATAAAQLKVASAERIRDTLVKALGTLHAMLDPAQREKLAYLIRTGVIQF